ncbi:MAG: hypothetical protein HETSPECPRED_000731 [Heterodermia speciosa]|uniref:GDP/GTP exchange factor Sec2 N-terminal domain-containing protein n=1 Tax=Heterodermia speciosa TaxID=116794 RepID=A0A8H3G7K0_9LECA|nr:MAG: hypothetical protein HETSPECPRED_000731 [Heterodermia speciosa]
MSTTTITTVLQPPPTKLAVHTIFRANCQECGADVSHVGHDAAVAAQRRIEELEQQVKILTDKATAAVDKLADYEDQLHQLKSQSQPPPATMPTATPPTDQPTQVPTPRTQPPDRPPSRPNSTVSRLSALLPSTRRSASTPPAASMPNTPFNHTPSPFSPLPAPPHTSLPQNAPEADLLTALTHETRLRRAAEARLSETASEVEELTSSLFSEANEMVARERKAVKRLGEEVEEGRRGMERLGEELEEGRRKQEGLERRCREREERVKVLERRAREKDERLERLEQRVGRGERVRGLLREGVGIGGGIGVGVGSVGGGGGETGAGNGAGSGDGTENASVLQSGAGTQNGPAS